MDESEKIILVDALNVIKRLGFHGGSISQSLRWLTNRLLRSSKFANYTIEVIVDNGGDYEIPRRTINQDGRSLDIVSCSGMVNGQDVDADYYIRNFIKNNEKFGSITIVTGDGKLETSIVNEVSIQGFDLDFMKVHIFQKKLG